VKQVQQNLRDKREEANLTQEELATQAKVTQQMISDCETGRRRPSPEVALRIADVLKIEISEMWGMFYGSKITNP
jgi:DNA-binding XRE family transcriptional regulator